MTNDINMICSVIKKKQEVHIFSFLKLISIPPLRREKKNKKKIYLFQKQPYTNHRGLGKGALCL